MLHVRPGQGVGETWTKELTNFSFRWRWRTPTSFLLYSLKTSRHRSCNRRRKSSSSGHVGYGLIRNERGFLVRHVVSVGKGSGVWCGEVVPGVQPSFVNEVVSEGL